MLPIVWDLDGTIVSTREANLMAYRSLGVEPPEDFDLRHWTTWTDKVTHDAKGQRIAIFIAKYATAGPLYSLYHRYGGHILTMASVPVIEALEPWIRSDSWIIRAEGRDEKVDYLRQTQLHGIYFDDSEETVERVNRETRWTAVLAQFASYLPPDRVAALLSGDIQTSLM